MRILLDECVPRPLRRELPAHDVQTVSEMGWAGKRNGELLSLIRTHGFDVFITVDQNLRYQQELRNSGISVVLLVAQTNRFAELSRLMPRVRAVLDSLAKGELTEVRS